MSDMNPGGTLQAIEPPAATPEPTTPDTGAATPPETGGMPQEVLDRFNTAAEQMAAYGPVLEQLGQTLPALQQQQAAPAEPEADPMQELVDYLSQGGNLDDQGQALGIDGNELRSIFESAVDNRVSGIVGDVQGLRQERTYDQLDALERQLPALQDPAVKQDVVRRTIESAQLLSGGDEATFNRLRTSPAFVRMTFFARDAELRAQGEVTPGADTAVVEGGGGVPPSGPDGDDPGAAIVAAGKPAGGFW